MQLFPHQQKALEDTQQFKQVAYYLDMGLGKTFVGSEKMKEMNTFQNVVICQKSKVQDWVEHFKEHYSGDYLILNLTVKKDCDLFEAITEGKAGILSENYVVGVINYDLVFRRSYFAHITGFTLMLDESSIIQNEAAKRSKFILKMQPENVICYPVRQQPESMKNCGRSFGCLDGISAKTFFTSSMLKWNGLKITTAGSEFPMW